MEKVNHKRKNCKITIHAILHKPSEFSSVAPFVDLI